MIPEHQHLADDDGKLNKRGKKIKIGKREAIVTKTQMLLVVAFVALFGSLVMWRSFADTPAPVNVPLNAGTAQASGFAPDQFLLRFRAGVDNAAQQALLNRYGLSIKQDIPQIETKVISVNPIALDAVIFALSHNKAVAFAEKDWKMNAQDVVPNDPYYTGAADGYNNQWPFKQTGTNNAWDKTTGDPTIRVAVLDTGFELAHPDFGTYADPWSVIRKSPDVSVSTDAHGIYTSGIVNAHSNNGIGVASTCWGCTLIPVQITTGSSAYTSDIATGITYAADHGARILNLSFAGTSSSSAEQSAEKYAFNKGALLFAAAGNSGCNCMNYPAADPGVVGVAALSNLNPPQYQGYSNYGSWVSIGAPSGEMTTGANGTYAGVGGTSMSSPFSAGIAGLLWSAQPQATADQIKQAIFSTATNIGTDANGRFTKYGRIDAYAAMTSLTGSFVVTPPDTTKPTISFVTPTNGTTVSGQIVVNVNASDNVAVASVKLVNFTATTNSQLFTGVAPYSFYIDTTKWPNGQNTICVYASDTSLNQQGVCESITVSNNATADATPPSATLSTPTNGSTVSGTVTVNGSATDNVGVTSTELYIDNVLRASSTSSAISLSWNTGNETNGTHQIVMKAYDAAGNVGSSATTTVTVNNQTAITDTQAPVATIMSPVNNTVISGTSQNIAATATDNVGVAKMEVYIDGSLKTSSATGNISYTWKINKGVKKGNHTIVVKAYDAANNIGSSTITVIK